MSAPEQDILLAWFHRQARSLAERRDWLVTELEKVETMHEEVKERRDEYIRRYNITNGI